ncbi:hypothetical protein JXA32_03315 [Candidatus Sumerlaeota bacterium]|nr:hypothetical protein [Candidatus Sumerlaeota bacterium]
MNHEEHHGSPADSARPQLSAEDGERVQLGIRCAQQIKTYGNWLNWLAGLIVLYVLFLKTAGFYFPVGRTYIPNYLHQVLMQSNPGVSDDSLALILILGLAAVFFMLGQLAVRTLKLAWLCLALGFLIYGADLAALYWLHFMKNNHYLDLVIGIEAAFHLFVLAMFALGVIAGLRYNAVARKEMFAQY